MSIMQHNNMFPVDGIVHVNEPRQTEIPQAFQCMYSPSLVTKWTIRNNM